MLQWTALHTGKYPAVEYGRHFYRSTFFGNVTPGVIEIFSHHNDASARSSQGLMSGGSDNMAMRQWIVEQAGCDHSGGMSNIAEEDGSNFVGDSAEAGVVPVSGIS